MRVLDKPLPLAGEGDKREVRLSPEDLGVGPLYPSPLDRDLEGEEISLSLTLSSTETVKVGQYAEQFAALAGGETDLEEVGEQEVLEFTPGGRGEDAEEGQS